MGPSKRNEPAGGEIASRVGERVGRYDVQTKLGEGGVGEVFLARDVHTDRQVALKLLHDRFCTDPELRQRFRREAAAAASLSHPNIIRVFDSGVHDGCLYLVMEYFASDTLAEVMSRGRLPWSLVTDLARQIASGLAAAHAAGIVHGDIKPANVLVNAEGQVKISDFGLAQSDSDRPAVPRSPAGTLPYQSPEQILGMKLDFRADLFSFGVLLYQLTTGSLPFTGDYVDLLWYAILHESPLPPRRQDPAISPDFERIVLRLLEKEPDARYARTEDLEADLRRLTL